jgi:hypothetical protein
MEPGDHVCLLFGGQVPFVLRLVDDHYLLIGEYYIESLMRSQAVERWQKGEPKNQIFELHKKHQIVCSLILGCSN